MATIDWASIHEKYELIRHPRLVMRAEYKAVGIDKTIYGKAIFDNSSTVEIEDENGNVHTFNKQTSKFFKV